MPLGLGRVLPSFPPDGLWRFSKGYSPGTLESETPVQTVSNVPPAPAPSPSALAEDLLPGSGPIFAGAFGS